MLMRITGKSFITYCIPMQHPLSSCGIVCETRNSNPSSELQTEASFISIAFSTLFIGAAMTPLCRITGVSLLLFLCKGGKLILD